jgi:micrococcal nuclease
VYEYKCKVTRVVDGDTCDVNVDLGFNLFTKDRVRLMGIDTPESRTRNLAEKKLGLAAKVRLKELFKGQKSLILKTSKEGKGKFGRILGTIVIDDGRNVNDILCLEGHARPYHGGNKTNSPWVKDGKRWTTQGYVPFK